MPKEIWVIDSVKGNKAQACLEGIEELCEEYRAGPSGDGNHLFSGPMEFVIAQLKLFGFGEKL